MTNIRKIARTMGEYFAFADASETIPGTRAVAQRAVNAENNFDQTLMDLAGISKAEASKVREYYIKNKIAKTDFVNGRISVKHGAYLDKTAIMNCVAIVTGKVKADADITVPELEAQLKGLVSRGHGSSLKAKELRAEIKRKKILGG